MMLRRQTTDNRTDKPIAVPLAHARGVKTETELDGQLIVWNKDKRFTAT